LREDIFEIAQELKSTLNTRQALCINTNGTLVNHHIAENLVRCFDEIRISIDGFEEENDLLRGNGSFNKALSAFEEIEKVGGDPIAFITVGSFNIQSLKDFLAYLLSRGIHRIHTAPLRLVGNARNRKDLLCPAEEIERAVSEFWRDTLGTELMKMPRDSSQGRNCFTCKHLNIYPDGSLYPCHVLSYPECCLGNIKRNGLSDVYLNSELLKKLRSLDLRKVFQGSSLQNEISEGNSCFGSFPDETYKDGLFQLLGHRSI